jgi:hypothetical protein
VLVHQRSGWEAAVHVPGTVVEQALRYRERAAVPTGSLAAGVVLRAAARRHASPQALGERLPLPPDHRR